MKPLTFLLLIIVTFCTCQNSGAPTPKQKILLPNTPTEVAQQWVEAFYKDDFSKAAILGTDLTRMMIDSVKKEMQANVPFIPFKISGMACEQKGDSAICTYIYQEEEDTFDEYVSLVKQNGQWLVNESWDNSSELELDFNMTREELEKLMEEEAILDKE